MRDESVEDEAGKRIRSGIILRELGGGGRYQFEDGCRLLLRAGYSRAHIIKIAKQELSCISGAFSDDCSKALP